MTRITASEVAGFVASRHGMTMGEFLNRSRSPRHTRPRQIAMYAIRQLCPHMSYPGIARVLAREDHTTVLHGVRRIESLLAGHERIAREVGATLTHFRTVEPVSGEAP
jgi:chromosomal replication initiator protein